MSRPAIFWDRDGTLIEDPGYLRDPDQVKLLPDASNSLKRLASAGYENIIATNQSGVARGMMDETTVEKIHLRLRELLAKEGAGVDAIYYCPYLDGPDAVVDRYRRDSDLRKPRPGMLVKAALERAVDLPASWSIGDNLRDAEAGRAAGCRTILVESNGSKTEPNTTRRSAVDFVAKSLPEAVDIILRYTSNSSPGPAAAASAGSVPVTKSNAGESQVLSEILTILQRMDRRARTEDFSLPRLAGAIVQMAAICALIWAVFALNETLGTQWIRLGYATLLQMMALTFFVIGGKK